nr:helix-hairpin-helix domain-containing protein [Akkermansiaceae bacterium]
MTREVLADTLDEIALLLELKGENPFKIRAYRQGAQTVRGFDGDIVQLAAENRLAGIKGIGEALREKLHLLATTGTLLYHQHLRAEFPPGLFDLFELQGLGAKRIKTLYQDLGVDSIAALQTACRQGRVAGLPGFGAKTATNILEAIALREKFADTFTLGAVTPLVAEMLDELRAHPAVSQLAAAGSYRRAKETVHDLDFLAATSEPEQVCRDFTLLPQVAGVIACGETKASVRLHNGLQCDLRAVSNASFPFALQYFTGSKEHNVALRSRAAKLGFSLNEYGLHPADPAQPPALPEIHEEADIYRALGLDYIPPELREDRGEFDAAAGHTLPALVELTHLRGTFHNHTTASDGLNTLEEMAAEAIELGLQYLGIADHSRSTFQANGLDEARLHEQVAKIRALNATFDGFRLLAGSEVDILKDGTLDFDDDTLAALDYCVA